MSRKNNKDEYGATYADTAYKYNGVPKVDLVQDDIGAVLDMGIEAIKRYGGRPPVYEPTMQGLEAFKQETIRYFNHVKTVNMDENMEKKVVCDIEGWCVFCGITRMTLCKYYRQRGSEWKNFIDYVKEIITTTKKQNAFTYRTPPMIAVFDLVNNSNYVNTNQVKITTDQAAEDVRTINGRDVSKELADNGLVWDDVTGEFVSAEE